MLGSTLLAALTGSACRQPADLETVPAEATQPTRSPAALRLTEEKPLPTVAVRPSFRDVASQLGIDFTFYNDEVEGRYFLPEVMGGGAAWLDYDLDGQLDLYLANGAKLSEPDAYDPRYVNRLFQNRDGQFADVSVPAAAAHGGFGQGICVADFDADGFPDLYVSNFGRNLLLRNNGDGTFQDVTESAGVGDPLWGTSPAWVDLNGDDLVDLFVTNYLVLNQENTQVCQYDGRPGYCGPGTYEAAPDRAYLSNGDGTFTEAAEALGLTAPDGKGLAIAVADFDNDARPEIYVANDMAANFLFHRADDGSQARYEDVAPGAGCAVSEEGKNEASMGVACGDFDGDGLIDLFLTHYYSHKNTLYRNLGGLLFEDDSRRTRIAATSFETLGFGTVALDYDLDGWRDLFIANGHVLGPLHQPNEMHPQLLHNDGSGRFEDVSRIAGPYFDDLWLGRGAAGGDYDNDGDTDLLVTHLHRPVALLRNETPTPHHFIGLDLQMANRLPPVGASVKVTTGEGSTVTPVIGGGSYLSSGDPRLVIGLGDWQGTVDVEVIWPGGDVQSFPDLATDRYWRLRQGAGAAPLGSLSRRPADAS